MSSELRAIILYLGGFQLILVGRIAKVPGMLYLGIVNLTFLLLFMLFFGGGVKFFKRNKDNKLKTNDNESWSIFRRWSRFIFAHIFYSGIFYLLTLSFLLRQFVPTIWRGIIISTLGIIFIFLSFLSHFSFEKIYFIRKLMVPIDYVLGFSVMIFGLVSFLLKNGTFFIQYGIASLSAFLFVLIIAKFGKLIYKNTIFKFVFVKLYIIILLLSLSLFLLREWTIINGGIYSSWGQKLNFVMQDIDYLIKDLGYGNLNLGNKTKSRLEIKKNNLTGKTINSNFQEKPGNIIKSLKEKCGIYEIGSKEMKKCIDNIGKTTKTGNIKNIKLTLTGNNITGNNIGKEETTNKEMYKNQFNGKLENFVIWRDLLHYLFSSGDLIEGNVNFSNISKNDKDYKYFVTAYKLHMIGTNILPDSKILCEIYMVILGLFNNWNVNITNRNNIFTPYRNKAKDLGLIKGCKKGEFVKFKNL